MKVFTQFNLFRFVKSTGKFSVTIAVFIIIVSSAHFNRPANSFNEKVDEYFIDALNEFSESLEMLKKSGTAPGMLKEKFLQCRLSYKKFAVLSEYFNVYETKFINGPALPRSEDGTPDVIIPAQGLQAIEEVIYDDEARDRQSKIDSLTGNILRELDKMKNEPDRVYKFRQELVWDAVRSASVRLVALGLTGFDSPVALNSIAEGRTTVMTLKKMLAFFAGEPGIAGSKTIEKLSALLDRANAYLIAHNNFSQFDRLQFITTYFSPFYKQLVTARQKAGIGIPQGRSAVNYNAQNIFSKEFFDIRFFSPGNEYGVTKERIILGKKLFTDAILSGTNSRSCASCHNPAKAFTDGMRVPLAMDNKTLLKRNTPTLWNSALQTRQFFDTRSDMLENQLKEVVHDVSEMEGSLAEAARTIEKNNSYASLFSNAYPSEKDPVSPFTIANAISSYIRTLISFDSKLDLYLRGNTTALTGAEKRGFNLFTGKAKCATCHFLPLFNGLVPPDFSETESEVLGVPATKDKLKSMLDPDVGKYGITESVIHKFAFKTPTLRNISLTAPYMHNGVFTTLEEVMDFYNEGGGAGLKIAPENQTLPAEKLNLSKQEIADIIAFMKALTDPAARRG